MKHFYATLFIAGLFGLYISAGASEVQPLLPCAISGVICTIAAGIGSIGFNRTERRDKSCTTRAKSAKADFHPKYVSNSATLTNGQRNVM
ncbi:MAG: hypothetical protein ACQGTM_15610 [bacterium]